MYHSAQLGKIIRSQQQPHHLPVFNGCFQSHSASLWCSWFWVVHHTPDSIESCMCSAGSTPAPVSSLEQIIRSMQQIKAAAALSTTPLAPARTAPPPTSPIPPSAPSGSQAQPPSSKPVTTTSSAAAVYTADESRNASQPIGNTQHGDGKQNAVNVKVKAEPPEQAVTNGNPFPAMRGSKTGPARQQSGDDSESMSRTALESQGAAGGSQSALGPSEEAARQSPADSMPAGTSSRTADKPTADQGRTDQALEDAGADPGGPSSSKPAHATAKPASNAKDEKKSSSREDKLEKKSGRDSKRSEVDRKASKGKRHRSRSKSRSRSPKRYIYPVEVACQIISWCSKGRCSKSHAGDFGLCKVDMPSTSHQAFTASKLTASNSVTEQLPSLKIVTFLHP